MAGAFEIDHEQRRFWCSPEFVLLVGQRMTFDQAATCPGPSSNRGRHPRPAARLRKLEDRGRMLHQSLDLRVRREDGAVRWVRLYYELRRDRTGASQALRRHADRHRRAQARRTGPGGGPRAGAKAAKRDQVAVPGLDEPRDPYTNERACVGGAAPAARRTPVERRPRPARRGPAVRAHAVGADQRHPRLSKIEAGQMQLAPERPTRARPCVGVGNLLAAPRPRPRA